MGSLLASLSPQAANALYREKVRRAQTRSQRHTLAWRSEARAKQLPPAGDWFCWMILSGRGFGKTWTGANYVIERAYTEPGCVIALIGQTKADVRDTMVELGDSCILKQSPDWFMPNYEPSKRRLVWPNGSVAIIYSSDEPGQLRGPQHHYAWVDELAKFRYPDETWDMMEFGLRLGEHPRVLVTTTPRPIPLIKKLLGDSKTVPVTGSTFENEANLAPHFLDRLRVKYEGTRIGRQELYGAILDDMPGALWNRAMLETNRVTKHPDLRRIVVAVDPAVTDNEDSNETGIVVAGIDATGHGYMLDDKTLHGSPREWASQAVAQYHARKADRIVAETNNGGDMIEHTIRTVDKTVAFKQVHASRGKHTRAEPVAALYEQGKIHHVGMFGELEDQLCSWTPGMDSPDRLDALVWAFTELMLGKDSTVRTGNAPKVLVNYRGG
ncbi:MAG: terminase family protein [Bryobacterales bacterium]|nr:terminase family protein [Bryobacterales bacterium]